MALTPQQLQALFQSISAGSQGAFSGATPGMNQDERNQWINSYGSGGTNYGDYLKWYGGAHGTNNQAPSGTPPPLMASLPNPSGTSYTPGGSFSGGAGSFAAGAGGGAAGGTPPPDSSEVRTKAGAGNTTGVWNPTPANFGWHQYYSPGSGPSGPNNPYAVGPSGSNLPPTTGGVTPPPYGNPVGGGGGTGAKPKSGYSFASSGWSQPSPWGKTQWH